MTDSIHQQLLGHLLGALDDDEQDWLEGRLECDAECRAELARWHRRLAPLEAMRPDFDPPAGLAERTCRMVATWGPVPARKARAWRGMTPEAAAPHLARGFRWVDVLAASAVLLLVVALVFPAIEGSRFQARLNACQGNLRQLGSALVQYSQRHGNELADLAVDGRLTAGGLYATELLHDPVAGDGSVLCPDAWLAAQGIWHTDSPFSSPTDCLRRLGIESPGRFLSVVESHTPTIEVALSGGSRIGQGDIGLGMPPQVLSVDLVADATPRLPLGDIFSSNDGSGTWRDGTTSGLGSFSPTALAILADAPSANLPGQAPDSHGGQGRNIFFQDGHIDFVPCTAVRDGAETFSSGGLSFEPSGRVMPISFTNWR